MKRDIGGGIFSAEVELVGSKFIIRQGDQEIVLHHDWLSDLTDAVEQLTEVDSDDYDDSMDGDFDSAMASAGHGTDEDYWDYGDGE